IVNRLWKRYLGWGLVEPVDDWMEATASHPELLQYLARELLVHDYDLKHVARLVLNSHTYQRAVPPDGSKSAEARERLFAGLARFAAEPANRARRNTDAAAAATGGQWHRRQPRHPALRRQRADATMSTRAAAAGAGTRVVPAVALPAADRGGATGVRGTAAR